ncbi:MAG: hypothetical protein M3P87_04665 [Actinomycetota bacterium]|nr:hypothetical protein [Actinomycetota bacterium]
MIDIPALRLLIEAGESRVAFDLTGEVFDGVANSTSQPALLVVSTLTEAVKVVGGGLVRDSLDRDEIWSVEGFILSREVLAALDQDLMTSGELIEAVTDAGFEWEVVSPSSSSP